jgi:glycosyltransferase involved in cell wall biosynthesis
MLSNPRSICEQGESGEVGMCLEPLVSVVTPFYNTVEYLAECIESVLNQNYKNLVYILVDNCSTDGSSEVAERYASLAPGKIRLIRTKAFLSQVQNYNYALSFTVPGSKYIKMVQADDWIFPDCIREMVEVAETHPDVGIVASYELEGDQVSLDGLPFPSPEVDGREICRRYFLDGTYLFGTPTSVLMRSDLLKGRTPFYEERFAPFEDAHACFDLLRAWKYGFVHQVLTYSRRDNESILSSARMLGSFALLQLSIVLEHGKDYLSEEEFKVCRRRAERGYYVYLCRCALRGRSREFWRSHREMLASINCHLSWYLLGKWMPRALAEKMLETLWSWYAPDRAFGPHNRG